MEAILNKYSTLCLIVTLLVACKEANSQPQKETIVKEQQKEVVDTQEHNCVTTEPQGPIDPDSVIYDYCEEMPEFPGGIDKMLQFIADSIHQPQCVVDGKVKGRCVAEIIVEKDGSLSEIKIVRSLYNDLHRECDAEALRVLKSMPRWKPGRQRGKPVRVKYVLYVQF